MQDPKKSPKIAIPQLCRTISLQLRHLSTIGKNLLRSNISSTCPHNMVNFDTVAAEIHWRVWGTPANFIFQCINKAIADIDFALGTHLLPLYTTTKSTSVAPPGEHVGNSDYVQHGAHVDAANAMRHMASYVKHDVIHKTGSTNLLHWRPRRTEPRPQVTYGKFREV